MMSNFTALDHADRAALFESVCEQSFDSIMVTTGKADDGGYPIIYVNQAFTEMTGYGAGEVLGKSPGLLQGQNTDASVLERLASDLAAGRTFHGRAVNYRKDGSEFMLEWKVVPVAIGRDPAKYLVAVQREVQ